MRQPTAHLAKRIFDGSVFLPDSLLLVENGRVAGIVPSSELPSRFEMAAGDNDLIAPGFVDLQVNGGGGALFNEHTTLAGIEAICSAHAQFGTTALLPTLITDSAVVRDRAIAAGKQALEKNVPGYLGLHLEGPHLSFARKGAHDPDLIRPMDGDDLEALLAASGLFGKNLLTVAPENATTQQVTKLSDAGWLVSLGHTDCKAETAFAYFQSGARMVTHLFNAMSQIGNREPGLVGAALVSDPVYCGLIADGIHVDPSVMKLALRAKRGPGRIYFVTDAMSPTGTNESGFSLGGRKIYRRDGRLTLEDGTLAGADIDMISMVRLCVSNFNVALEDALKMASLYPAELIGAKGKGHLTEGGDADFLTLDRDLGLKSTWIDGQCVYESKRVEAAE